MATTDATSLIERLEAFEDRMGVRLESVGAKVEDMGGDSVYLKVSGELHPQSGTELRQDVELVIAAYDTSSKIVGTGSRRFGAEGFFGLRFLKN